jgi:hypothetical protein
MATQVATAPNDIAELEADALKADPRPGSGLSASSVR